MVDNSDLISLHAQVALLRAIDFEAILHILVDAAGGERGVALAVSRNDAHLELLEVLVVLDAADKDVVLALLRHHAAKIRALELEGLILLDVNARDAAVEVKGYCIDKHENMVNNL